MMETENIQEPKSAATGNRQAARSMAARRPAPSYSREEPERSAQPLQGKVATGTQVRQAPLAAELEEYFEGFVTEIADAEIRLSTVSSEGEEGDAWLPRSMIPADEIEFLELGVPVRVNVRVVSEPHRERTYGVRFLRPHQWYRPTEQEAGPSVEHLVKMMREVLSEQPSEVRDSDEESAEGALGAA